ncbi:MAG: hypothetical protein ACQEQG_06990 [Bacillota bacterium]
MYNYWILVLNKFRRERCGIAMSENLTGLTVLTIVLALLLIVTPVIAQSETEFSESVDEQGNLRLENEYIAIVVNQSDNAKGRFAVETTGGDPAREDDTNKSMIYGRPQPWTSYTTLRIDGENYVFGGETERRAGEGANYGELVQRPQVINDAIVTTYEISSLQVEQSLQLVRSSTTGLSDTTRIEYNITNIGEEPKELGLRVMLDTMLGENDGAPFRVEDRAITTDTRFDQEELPPFYQSFDSLTDPQVTSQGSFSGPNVDTPDRVYMSDWGSLADDPWDFNFNPGEEFVREGEFEIDSAIALYWDPETIEPNETFSYTTEYGLGGITMVPGLLSLGVTSPAEFAFSSTDASFPVVAYIENTAGVTAENVTASLELPSQLDAENVTRELGDLSADEVTQVSWYVSSTSEELPDNLNFSVTVDADNTDSNLVERSLRVIPPAQIEAELFTPEDLVLREGDLYPVPYTIRAVVENTGGSTFYGFESEMILPPGLDFASYEKASKNAGMIRPGESLTIDWKVIPLQVEGIFPYALQIRGQEGYSRTLRERINIPATSPTVYLVAKRSSEDSDYITLQIKGSYLSDIENIEFGFSYNSELLKPIYHTRGTAFVRDDRLMAWRGPEIESDNIFSYSEELPAGITEGGIATVVFRLNDPDVDVEDLNFEFVDLLATDGNEQEVELRIEKIRQWEEF